MIINNKEFTQIKSHQLYYISRDSEVYTTIKKRILKPGRNSVGYKQLWLIDNNGQARWERIHVLNALTFVDNPDNLPEVNHDDGNKDNNWDWNLKWCTRQQNQQHAVDTGLLKLNHLNNKGKKHSEETKKLMSINKLGKKHPKYTGDYITPKGTFNSIRQAAIANDLAHKTVKKRCLDNQWLYAGWNFTGAKPEVQYNQETHNAPQVIIETKRMSVSDYTKTKHSTTLTEIVLLSGRTMKIR